MYERRITTGDPGLEKMADLQEIIRRNVGARHIYRGQDAQIVRLRSGIVARGSIGPPPPRGVGTGDGPPAKPPYEFNEKLPDDGGENKGPQDLGDKDSTGWLPDPGPILPPKRDPYFPDMPGLPESDKMRGEFFSAYINGAASSCAGVAIGPFPGPAYLDSLQVGLSSSSATLIDFDLDVRVDFAQNSSLDSFTFVNNSFPTGASSAPVVLFRNQTTKNLNVSTNELNPPGWYSMRPFTLGQVPLFEELRFPIRLDSFFIKVYISNDAAGLMYKVQGVLRLP